MLQCSRCKRMFDEYYRMSDGRILCKDCWRDELNLAEMKAVQGRQQRAQVLRDKDAFEQKRKADQVRLEQLEHAIKLEKGKCHSAWSSWDDGYRTDKPYNYEEVELLKRQHLDLSRQLNQNQWFKFPSTPPFSDNTAYYKNARFISKSQSHYFETVTLPAEQEAKRKAEEERIRAEQARIKAEQERQKKAEEERRKKEAELRPYEEDILNKKKVPCHLRVKVAKETYREEVMLRCVRDSAVSVFNALKLNPNLTYKVREAIQKKEYQPPMPAQTSTPLTPSPTPSEPESGGSGCFWFIVMLCIIGGVIYMISNR